MRVCPCTPERSPPRRSFPRLCSRECSQRKRFIAAITAWCNARKPPVASDWNWRPHALGARWPRVLSTAAFPPIPAGRLKRQRRAVGDPQRSSKAWESCLSALQLPRLRPLLFRLRQSLCSVAHIQTESKRVEIRQACWPYLFGTWLGKRGSIHTTSSTLRSKALSLTMRHGRLSVCFRPDSAKSTAVPFAA